jgi:HEAT repeat protein
MLRLKNRKTFEEAGTELAQLGKSAVPYLLDRAEKACQVFDFINGKGLVPLKKEAKEGDLNTAAMLPGISYCMEKIGEEAGKEALLPLLIERFENTSDDNYRFFLLSRISALHDENAIELLEAVLINPKEVTKLRGIAASGLSAYNNQKCIEVLISVLKEDKPSLKKKVVTSLGNIGSKEATLSLIPLLLGKDEILRAMTVNALRKIGDKRAVESLIPLLKDDSLPVRMFTVKALGQLEDVRAVPFLKEALNNEDCSGLKENIKKALKKIGNEKESLGDTSIISILVGVVESDKNPAVRRNAIRQIGHIVGLQRMHKRRYPINKSPIPILIQALESDEDETVRRTAASALWQFGDKFVVPALIKALKDRNEGVQKEVIFALSILGDKSLDPIFIESLNSKNERIRLYSAGALNKWGGRETLVPLQKAAKQEENREVKKEIIDAIEVIKRRLASGVYHPSNSLLAAPKIKRKLSSSSLDIPEGEIVFSYRDRDVSCIYKINADGTDRILLYKNEDKANSNCSNPEWSEDGSKIYFIAMKDGKWFRFVMDSDGRDVKAIRKAKTEELMYQPWENKNLFVKDGSLYLKHVSQVKQLYKHYFYSYKLNRGAYKPVWSSDKKYIMFAKSIYSKISIIIVNKDGKILLKLANSCQPDWKQK